MDRLSIRERPPGIPIMYQTWGKLLFLHWAVEPEVVRPFLPEGVHIDTFDGKAWIGVTPFTMWGLRPPFLPPAPFLSRSNELNVRTYVHAEGVPGVWFFSLDAGNPFAVVGARTAFFLPYYHAHQHIRFDESHVVFLSQRTHPGARTGHLECEWEIGDPLGEAVPGSLEFFLAERYCLYTERQGQIYRGRIHHRPWPLRTAHLKSLSSTMLEANGLPPPDHEPCVHHGANSLHVKVWPLERVAKLAPGIETEDERRGASGQLLHAIRGAAVRGASTPSAP